MNLDATASEVTASEAASALRVAANRASLTGDPMRDVLSVMADAVTVMGRTGELKIDERVIRSAMMSAVLRVSKDGISTARWWLLAVTSITVIVLCVGSVAVDRYLVRTPDDPRWLSLAAMNDIGEAWRTCQPVAQASGEACLFALWKKLPVARQHN